MSLEEEQAAKRKAEAQLDNEQGKVQKLMMVVAKLQAIQSEKATSAAPFCTSTIQGSCKSKVRTAVALHEARVCVWSCCPVRPFIAYSWHKLGCSSP